MNITITLDTHDFERSEIVFRADTSLLNADMIQQLVYHGITQKVGDAAAGKHGDDAEKAMRSTWDSLVAGNWGKARAAAGEPAWMSHAMAVVRANLSKENAAIAKAEKDPVARAEFIRGIFDGLDEDVRAVVVARAKERLETARAQKAADKALGAGL